jgi:hypothetical protein
VRVVIASAGLRRERPSAAETFRRFRLGWLGAQQIALNGGGEFLDFHENTYSNQITGDADMRFAAAEMALFKSAHGRNPPFRACSAATDCSATQDLRVTNLSASQPDGQQVEAPPFP